jgi:hypothetical protein
MRSWSREREGREHVSDDEIGESTTPAWTGWRIVFDTSENATASGVPAAPGSRLANRALPQTAARE